MRDEGMRGKETGGKGEPSSYTVHNFNLHYMTREWRLIKHDNGRAFIVNPSLWLSGSKLKGQRMHNKNLGPFESEN